MKGGTRPVKRCGNRPAYLARRAPVEGGGGLLLDAWPITAYDSTRLNA